MLYSELTHESIDAYFEVSNELGVGFLESVYQNALLLVVRQKGIAEQVQVPLVVRFRGQIVGQFVADMVVEGKVLLELKAVRALLSCSSCASCLSSSELTIRQNGQSRGRGRGWGSPRTGKRGLWPLSQL